MKDNLDFDLAAFGVMLSALGMLAHWLAPDFGYATLVTGIVGGGLATFWGALGMRGIRRRRWPIGTLIAVDIALLVQACRAWLGVKEGTEILKRAALILTVLLACGIVELINYVRASRREQ